MSQPEGSVVDVAYTTRGGVDLLARIYRPPRATPSPVPGVVAVHGGAWNTGDRLDNAVTAGALAASGVVVMDIDFRMPPTARYPAPVADINLAIRWFRSRAGTYGVDPDRVGGLGYSSGGHQLALSALRPDDHRWAASPPAAGPRPSADLSFLVLVYAVLDPVARYQMAKRQGLHRLVDSHHAYWPDEPAMEQGSPQHILEAGLAERLPRTLVIQGVLDENLTPDMADRFGAAYGAAGGVIEVLRLPDAPHRFLRAAPESPAARLARERIVEFVHR